MCFWYVQVALWENTISGHYIIGSERSNILFNFPNHTEVNFKSNTQIFTFFHFLVKNSYFLPFFDQKSNNCENFCLALEIDFCMIGKVEKDGRTFTP